jgi:hypothetical protein
MTPAKYKALSKDERRAYRQESDAWMKAFDARIDARNAEAHKRLATGLVQLVQQDPAVERDIVHNFLERKQQCLVDRAFFEKYPLFDSAYASYELKKLMQRKSAKKAVSTETGQVRRSAGKQKGGDR